MSFLSDLLHAESGEVEPRRTDDDAIQALATLSATNHVAPQEATEALEKGSAGDKAVGYDSSQVLHQASVANMDPTTVVQHVAENREPAYIRQEPTTTQIRQAPENLALSSLKHEHSSRTQSPLRESSIPMPSTELPTTAPVSKKRPAPKNSVKKGTASTVKKDPAAKKRKPESASSKPRPKSSANKRLNSTAGTPANSSPGPRSVRTASSPPRSSPEVAAEAEQAVSEDEEEEDGTPGPDDELYCLCRRPDTGTFMIGCDGGCDDWFHGKCVGISERDKGLIDRYICPNCENKGIGVTTWKRMCRREGCRMPAKVQASQTSKYCSDECGVLFFKTQMAKARSAPGVGKNNKKSAQNSHDDLGARGGLLSLGEIKAMLNAAPTLEQFRRLGEGVLSTPATPPKAKASNPDASEEVISASHESALNDIERERIEHINQQKQISRARHSLLKDRAKFISMLKQNGIKFAEEHKLKPKEMCGYDARITWTEEQFNNWRGSTEGQEALQTNILKPVEVTDTDGDTSMNGGSEGVIEPCTKRKCAKHYEWAKLALDDTRFETTENAEKMRALEKEEKEIKQRAQLRAREIRAGGVGGSVEFHEKADGEKSVKGETISAAEENVKMETCIESTKPEEFQEEKITETPGELEKMMDTPDAAQDAIMDAPDKTADTPVIQQDMTDASDAPKDKPIDTSDAPKDHAETPNVQETTTIIPVPETQDPSVVRESTPIETPIDQQDRSENPPRDHSNHTPVPEIEMAEPAV